MPCACKSVSADYLKLIHIVQLQDLMCKSDYMEILKSADEMHWNCALPGGFTQNTPQRLVNSYGNGCGYDERLKTIGKQWDTAYWTAAVHQSDVTMVTPTADMPIWLKKVGLTCRKIASERYDIKMTEHSFNLAVCNQYVEHHHEIAAHTDDNEWYVKDLPEHGPIFASLTLYPRSKPCDDKEYARFEIYIDEKWHHLQLPHASLLFMPSCIPHRVRPVMKNQPLHHRINITLRSVPSIESDPFNSLRGVSNHARYYRLPEKIIIPKEKETNQHVIHIVNAFKRCLVTNKSSHSLVIERLDQSHCIRKRKRSALTSDLKKRGRLTSSLRGNVTNELLLAVMSVS
jgi:hypothetical protein